MAATASITRDALPDENISAGCCPVCLETFSTHKIAKLLPRCFHTVCDACVDTLPEPKLCPLDRMEFELPGGGAKDLTTNYALMEMVLNDGKGPSNEIQQAMACISCEEKDATCRCVECEGDPLCEKCWNQHVKPRSCRHHQRTSLADWVGVGKLMCAEHPSQELLYFCVQDHALFCAYCYPTSPHKDHQVVAVSKAIQHVDTETIVKEATEQAERLRGSVELVKSEQERVSEAGVVESKRAAAYFDELFATFAAQKEAILKKASDAVDVRTKHLSLQCDQLVHSLASLESVLAQIKYHTSRKDHARAVQFATQLLTLSKSTQLNVDLNPSALADFAFSFDQASSIAESFGTISSKTAQECTAEGGGLMNFRVDEENTFTLTAQAAGLRGFLVEITPEEAGRPEEARGIPCKIDDAGDGRYICTYVAPSKCPLKITASYLGSILPQFPFTVEDACRFRFEGNKSEIITPEISAVLFKMLPDQTGGQKTLRLLHHLAQGATAADFDRAVAGHGKILTVIKSNSGFVFGGYFDEVFGHGGGWTAANATNFLFLLGKDGKGPFCKRSGANQIHLSSCGLHMGQRGQLVAFCSWSACNVNSYHEFCNVDDQFNDTSSSTICGDNQTSFVPLFAEVFTLE